MTVHRFNRIAWGQVHRDRSCGVIAAGMENGELALWDPAKIVVNAEYVCLLVRLHRLTIVPSVSESLILRNTSHTGPVRGLDFNPIQTSLLSSGAINGEVWRFPSANNSPPNTFVGLYLGSQ